MEININVLVDAEKIKNDNVSGAINDEYLIMTDNQYDDSYENFDVSRLVTRVKSGDVLIWTIKTRSGIGIQFKEIDVNGNNFFVEGDQLLPDPSDLTTIKGTVSADIIKGAICSYNILCNLEDSANTLNFDPLIEARTTTP